MTDTTATTKSRNFAAVACCVFVGVMMCSIFVGSIASVGSVNAVATEQDNASFMTDQIVRSSGSVVNVRIDLAGANAATVLIEGRQNDYTANVTVYDTTDDGTVTLSFDTSQATQNDNSFDTGGDDLRVRSDGSSDHTMAGAYNLKLQTGSTTMDAATLTLQPTAVDSLTTQTAPGSKFSALDTIANVSEVATDDQRIAIGDVMILQLSAPELSDALAEDTSDAEAESATEPETRLLELIQSGTIDIQIRQTNARDGTAKAFNLSATIENGGVELLYDEEDVYLLIDTKRAVFDRDKTTVGIETGDQFESTVTGNKRLENETTVSESVRFVSRSASFDTGETGRETITVKSDTNQTITGETSVAPGTNLTIQAKADSRSSFVITRTAQVQTNGTFGLTLDFTNVTKGTRFVFMIPNQGFTDNASVSGIVRRPSTASVSVDNQNIRFNGAQTVVIHSVDLSDGGFVAVYDRSFLDSNNKTKPRDALRGTSQYLTAGEHTNVSIPLSAPYANSSTIVAVPYLDTNDNNEFDVTADAPEDDPYSGADGEPVVNAANVSVGGETGDSANTSQVLNGEATSRSQNSSINSSNPKDDEESNAHPSGDSATGASGNGAKQTGEGRGNNEGSPRDADTETTGGEGAGFGLIVGLVAIGVLALLAARQSN